MIRGIQRRKIFINKRDREDFLGRLSKLLPQTETTCYAWVFIPNHAHFLFRTGLIPLASLMRRLLTRDTPLVSTTATNATADFFRIYTNLSSFRKIPI
jgi:hypothetical protein